MDTTPRPRPTGMGIPLGRGHSLRLFDRPGRKLGAAALTRLLSDLREIADRCVPSGGLRYGVLSGERARMDRAVIAVIYDGTRRPVGFNAMSWLDIELQGEPVRVLHAGLCMIVPGSRRGGLLGLMSAVPALLAFATNRFAPLWVTNVTQVPAVAGLFAESVGSVYPAPGRSRPPSAKHRWIAEQLMEHHRHVFGVGADAEFDAERFIIRNSYTGGSDELKKSYEQAGKHRDPRFNRLCRELLDYQRGDDLLQVGRLTLGVVASLVATCAVRIGRRTVRALQPIHALPSPALGAKKGAIR